MAETAKTPTTSIRILMYHHVGRFPRPSKQRGLYCHIDQFTRQMGYLARTGLPVISMDRALEALSGRQPLAQPGIVLTFDDGFQNFGDFAWPVLKAHGFPATLYAISDLLGGRAEFLTHPAICSDQLMSGATLRALADDGLDVGGHTATHPSLSTLPHDKRDDEISGAKRRLEDILGREVRHFAYPRGDYDSDARDRVAAAGFASAVTTKRARADKAPNVFEIPRIGISFKDGLLRYRLKARWRYNRVDPD